MTDEPEVEMPSPCDSVYAFMDGELAAEVAENYRHHLAGCAGCAERLRDAWYLDERLQRTSARQARQDERGARRRRAVLLAATAVLVATAVLALRWWPPDPPPPPAISPTHRMVQARAGDRYLLPETERALLGGPVRTSVPLRAFQTLGALERHGDSLAVASALVEWGMADQALPYLERAAPSPERDAVASAALLEKHPPEPEKALELADRALRQRPGHGPALWNRALALERLGLLAAAGKALEDLAKLGEPGWGAEAAGGAARLRGQLSARRDAYLAADRACRRMLEAAEPVPVQWAAAVPGEARDCLYHAVRAASSPAQVRRLLPLARFLDALDGGGSLAEYVEGVARRDFARRRPLAEQYRRLTLRELKPEEAAALADLLRSSGERDLLFGALSGSARHAEELAALLPPAGDPWLEAVVEERKVLGELARGELHQAVTRLLRATGACVLRPPPARASHARCAKLKRQLAMAYASLSRTAEARAHGLEALELAKVAGEWALQSKVLAELGQNARQAGQLALSLAYLEEIRQREPTGCDSPGFFLEREKPLDWDFVHSTLALTRLRALDFQGARAELQEARRCGPPRKPTRLFAMADLARRFPPTPEDIAAFGDALERVWPEQKTGGRQAMVLHVQGRFEMAVGLARADELLRRAIRLANELPEDTFARKARAYSYTSLILAAGKRGAFDEAFALFAEELGLPAPRSCALAVTVDDERTLALVRGPGGATRGHSDDGRVTPLESAAGLVPESLQAELHDCASVQVLARPPVVGLPGLLSREIAWSYLAGPARGAAPAPAPPARSLLVTNPMPPAEQGLPDVGVFPQESLGAGLSVLQGAEATPARVLEEMARASEVYIHAHGLLEGPSEAAYIALSPDRRGSFALTAHDLRRARLEGRPVVVLIACEAAHTAPYLHEAFSLPAAFLEAGARMIVAATVKIPSDEAARFFGELLRDIRAGAAPAVALRDARRRWRTEATDGWVEHVLLFQAP